MADFIFVLIIVIALFLGRRFGFLRGLINLVCVVVSSLGGYILYPYFTAFLVKTPLFDAINSPVNDYITKTYLKGTPVETLNTMLLKYNVSTIEEMFAKMAQGVTTVIINIISIIVIFLAIRFLLTAVKGIARILSKLPVIAGLDKTLGMILGAVTSLVIMYLLVAVMMVPPCNTSELSVAMCENIDNSLIVKKVMDYNIFINYESLSELGREGFEKSEPKKTETDNTAN